MNKYSHLRGTGHVFSLTLFRFATIFGLIEFTRYLGYGCIAYFIFCIIFMCYLLTQTYISQVSPSHYHVRIATNAVLLYFIGTVFCSFVSNSVQVSALTTNPTFFLFIFSSFEPRPPKNFQKRIYLNII